MAGEAGRGEARRVEVGYGNAGYGMAGVVTKGEAINMCESTMPQDLWAYDVSITRQGTFTIYAKSLEEAKAIVNEMDEEELDKRVVQWLDTEVTSID